MKKFVWRAQKVLDVRKIEEQRKKNELLKIMENLTGKISLFVAKKALLREMLEKLNTQDLNKNFEQRRMFFRHLAVNDSAIEQLKKEIAALEAEQKEKIAELLKIRQYSQGLEKLRAQAKEKFYAEQEKVEQRQADEDAVMKYARAKVNS
ncbi:MAG: flagellar FliJ family protein [Phycisphaerae bacterium]|nr:flagellar FliJ family protein [Phycisphaerae bacterium]